MKKAYLYCDKRSLNDATTYYVDLVIDCLQERGYNTVKVFSLHEIKNPDLIFTVSNYNFTKAKLKFPFVKTINWKQGVAFEESKMTRPFYKWFPFYICELMAVLKADMQLFVSDKMNDYYRTHYHYRGNNHVIMPCYNLPIGEFFDIEKFKSPTFVYAGGIDKWQSIDILLDTYAIIEKEIHNSKLFMYVKNKEYLLDEAKKRGIKNIEVKYVPLEQLQGELQKYKYGFILREKNWVNNVATPTKMNSYLAAYLIPIFSDGVDDFKRNIDLGEFTIMARTPLNPQDIAEKIINFEKQNHKFSQYSKIVETIFKNHYNDDKYYQMIVKKMKVCGI